MLVCSVLIQVHTGWPGIFSQRGGLVHLTGKHLLVAIFRISNPWLMCRGPYLGHGISLCDSLYGVCFGPAVTGRPLPQERNGLRSALRFADLPATYLPFKRATLSIYA